MAGKKGFQKGNQFRFKDGNKAQTPSGTKGEKLAGTILRRTKGGKELVKFYYDVFSGKIQGNAGNTGPPSLKLRIQAAEWLTDRGFGRTPQVEQEVSGGINIQLIQYSDPNKPDKVRVINAGEDNNDTPQLPSSELPTVIVDSSATGVQEDDKHMAQEGGEGSHILEPDD